MNSSNFRWHLGYCHPSYLPTRRGFDWFVGFYGPGINYYDRSVTGKIYLKCLHKSTTVKDFHKNDLPYPINGRIYSTVNIKD